MLLSGFVGPLQTRVGWEEVLVVKNPAASAGRCKAQV